MTDRVEENMKAWPRNILLVEDQRSMRMMIKRIVMLMGVPHVLEAADGMRALSILKDSPVDFVVTDWGMPSINGLELMYLMRKDRELSNIPILFLTARADELSVQQALNAGANGYLLKPFAPAALKDKLRDMFAIQLNSETESLPSISDGEHP